MLGIGGWLAACAATALAALAWRTLGVRMEAVTRACHELRGPITAARLGLELGARSGELSPDRLRALDLELDRAGLALEDLSAVPARPMLGGRVGPGRAVGAIDLAALLRQSVEAWEPVARARGAELAVSWSGPAAFVIGDRVRIAQASGNLIANAIEHGGRRIHVRGRAVAGTATVEVLDDGPGLPATLAELTRGARSGHGSRPRSGHRFGARNGDGSGRIERVGRGRGLAITTGIARDHGGRLSAAASEHGARLVLELPMAPARGGAEAGPRGGAEAGPRGGAEAGPRGGTTSKTRRHERGLRV